MGTLYIVGVPATGPDDLTIRARRILGSAALVAAGDVAWAGRFLAACEIATALAPAARHDLALQALAAGDAALLLPGVSPVPGPAERSVVRAALEAGHAVTPVPGPVVSLTALILSGLPVDSFVYLDTLPREAGARRELVASMAGEARTLALLVAAGELLDLLPLLHASWGDRPLVLWPASSGDPEDAWRGSLDEALLAGEVLAGRDWVLVVGGAPAESGRPWAEDRLRGEVRDRLERGMGVGQVSRDLAAASGWARRDVYRLSVEEHERMGH